MRAITFSSGVNAWSLRVACRMLHVDLFTTDTRPTLPIPRCAAPPPTETRLLFTEERSLGRFLAQPEGNRFYPMHFPTALLDDKLAFADWLVSIGEKPVPFGPVSKRPGEFPVILKPRHSWRERKLPRGWVCRNASELARAEDQAKRDGVQTDWLFVQPWYGDRAPEVISVCGFFDVRSPHRNLMCVVRRLADAGTAPACSAMVATVADPARLVERAAVILGRLAFTGPFELEFLGVGGEYLVLELNPRFWMQNGLFLCAGNGLVKRYLDLDGPSDWQQPSPADLLWMDSVWFLIRLAKLDLRPIVTIKRWVSKRGYRLAFFPSLTIAMGLLLRSRLASLKAAFRPREAGPGRTPTC
jgi:hypothetical protein